MLTDSTSRKGSSPFASSALTCDDAAARNTNTRETHNRTKASLAYVAMVAALALAILAAVGIHQRANAAPVDPTWQQATVTIDDEATVAAAQQWDAPFAVTYKAHGADIHVARTQPGEGIVGGEATKTTDGDRITGCLITLKPGAGVASMAHEVGHCWGLHHRNEDQHSVMYWIQGGNSGAEGVTQSDREALALLYQK